MMRITEEVLESVLRMARNAEWRTTIPVNGPRIDLVVNSLKAQGIDFKKVTSSALKETIQKETNSNIRKILEDKDIESFAFAIRTSIR